MNFFDDAILRCTDRSFEFHAFNDGNHGSGRHLFANGYSHRQHNSGHRRASDVVSGGISRPGQLNKRVDVSHGVRVASEMDMNQIPINHVNDRLVASIYHQTHITFVIFNKRHWTAPPLG